MKILEIIPQLSSGGAERFTVDLCNELSSKHEIILVVLLPLTGNDFYVSQLSDKVKVVSLNKKRGIDISLLFRLYNFIKQSNPDVVHTHLRAITYTLYSIIRLSKVGFFHTIHNDAKVEAGGGISKFIRNICFKRNLVSPITISEESNRSFIDFYACNATMILNGRNIPSNLSISQSIEEEFNVYRRDDNSRVIVNLARIMPQKNQAMLAKVVSRLYNEGYDLNLLIIGEKTDPQIVSEIKLCNCPNIHILGERKNPLEYLKMADAYALSSSYEGMPISLIEAMGVGAVPVCTPVGGIVDVIKDGENGFISEDISEESYYRTLKDFLQAPSDKIKQLKAASLKSYEPYSMTECADKYIKLFQQ